jgi:hypothetical protein
MARTPLGVVVNQRSLLSLPGCDAKAPAFSFLGVSAVCASPCASRAQLVGIFGALCFQEGGPGRGKGRNSEGSGGDGLGPFS